MLCFTGHSKHDKNFLNDLSDVLAGTAMDYDRILIGDFNMHVCSSLQPPPKDFFNVLDSFNFSQHVTGPTRVRTHARFCFIIWLAGFCVL